MPKDVKYIILKFLANVVAISTKITDLLIIRKCPTCRPVECKRVQKHILHQKVYGFGINEFRITFPRFSYQVPKNTNTVAHDCHNKCHVCLFCFVCGEFAF